MDYCASTLINLFSDGHKSWGVTGVRLGNYESEDRIGSVEKQGGDKTV